MSETEIETTVTVVLRKPIGPKEKQITELTLREPTAGELALAEQAGAKKGGNEQMIALIGFSSGVHSSLIRNMLGGDFNKCAEIIGNFFEIGQGTGAT